jgi:acetolactate synthase-1/2/3 large subunit
MRTIADAVAETLAAYGVQYAFGIPGNDVLELIRACEERDIRFVLAKSEPSAAFMADAVYHLTRRPAALIAALGPGLANAISGIAGAEQERSPLIVLTGEAATPLAGIYTHQVFDQVALARPVTKYAAPLNPHRPAQHVAKALDLALAYPPGPVMLNIPADQSRAAAPNEAPAKPVKRAPAALDAGEAARLRDTIAGAKRPLALVGLGALHGDAPAAVAAFLRACGIPCLTSYKAKGILDEQDLLCLGAVGLSPTVDDENLRLVAESDCLVLIGFDPIELRDAWLNAWDPAKPCLAIDWGPLGHRMFPAAQEAFGSVPAILASLTQHAAPAAGWPESTLEEHRRAVAHIVRPRDPEGAISPAALFATVDAGIREDWTLTVDVGAHRILANHVLRCRTPGQLLQSNGLGHMGYALPAAIGAQLVRPDHTVVALVGDGCALMSLGDLALAAELDLPLVILVLNDDALSLIKLKQRKMQLEPRAVDFRSPRFDALAAGFGAVGRRVGTLKDLEAALDEAVAARRLTIIDALVDPAEYLEQM